MEQISAKRRIIYTLIPYFIMAGFLFMGEGFVRVKYGDVSKLALFTGDNFRRKVEVIPGRGRQVFDGDAMLGWKLMDGLKDAHWDFTTFSTNKQGMRYLKDIKRKKDGAVRVISLGDSVTFGYRVPVAFPENPLNYDQSQMIFTQLIESNLRNNNREKDVEVIPMAVPGYTSRQGFLWLKRDIGFLEPDLVIVLFGWNDTEMHMQSDLEALPDSRLQQIQREILSKSQALIYFNRWLGEEEGGERKTPEEFPVPRVSREDFIGNILAINELAKKNNSEVLVIGTVLRDNVTDPGQSNRIADYRWELARATRDVGINYLEIPVLTEAGYPGNLGLFGEFIHPNFLGHKVMAEEIFKAIKEGNLLGDIEVTF